MTASAKAPAPQTNYLIWLSYATIAGLWVGSQLTLIPYVIHLIVLVTAILYIACHKSLILREEPSEQAKADGTAAVETLRQEDAYQFPLMGSISLFSLYLAFRFLDKDMVNLLIGLYFGSVGCLAIFATVSSLLPKVGPGFKLKKEINHPIGFLVESPIKIDLDMRGSECLILLGSIVFCGFYFVHKHWSMNNILGICFCLQGIERFSLGTYKIGMILLIGLFFYDIL